ncbi:hypothetical protein WM16_07605 [Burkholderia ubonensis]|uniref:Uncharacterized protein n=1 Tax=Burkholderia ubonensis TaxID=101571 RepID=A0A108CR48_9BURK|nr:hypothetical protein [Burkholderia ubonensis]KWK79401.1 hypothetical protein WM16_07605 [Burkholderia ubonensis]
MKRDPEGSFVFASDARVMSSRADALTDDQRQALGEVISEYFGKLDSDEGIRAPEGRILRAFDYCDSRNVDDLIDRAIVPALAASLVEQPAQLMAQDALAAIETFEIVGDNNDSREPNADDRFILTEFIAHAFGGYPIEQPAAAPAIELSRVKETLESGGGFWRTCSGCHESEDGHPVGEYPYSEVLQCDLGAGCAECGGIGAVWDNTDYDDMAAFLDRQEETDETSQVATSANETGAEGSADEPYQVTIDVRDLFAYLRAAWREGQHYDREDFPDQADSWSAASDYAIKTIERWTSINPAMAAAAPADERAAWDRTRHALAVAMVGFASRTGSRNLDAAVHVLDALTEPGSPLAWLCTARAVASPAAEPVRTDVTYDDVVSACDAHGIALPVEAIDAAVALINHFAAPQPAQADAPAEAREVIVPLNEPVTIRKALLAGRTARVVLSGGDGTVAAVHLVNIGLTGWVLTKETADAYAKGFNQAAKWMQDAMCGAPADAGEPIGQHDLSTSTGGRAYIAEFFAKRLRRHDFGSYIAEWLAADFACALAQYLSEHDAASRAEPCVDLPRFPTMLRKMWSGGEVQRWIDENVAPRAPLTNAVRDVLAERRRHVEQEGWTPEHDDQHTDGAMARAAACYAYPELIAIAGLRTWPWDTTWWKPSAPRRNLVKAVALGIAEIERLDRAAARAGEHQ